MLKLSNCSFFFSLCGLFGQCVAAIIKVIDVAALQALLVAPVVIGTQVDVASAPGALFSCKHTFCLVSPPTDSGHISHNKSCV